MFACRFFWDDRYARGREGLDRQGAEQISASDHKEDVLMVTEVLTNMIDSLPFELGSVRVAVVVDEGSISIASFWEAFA